MSNSTFDVFISYSHHDVEWVKNWLLPRLEKAGLRVCVDFRDFKIGGTSLDNMADAAKRSRKTLFVMTPDWTVSEFSQFEALVIQILDPIGRKGRLLPLMLKDTDLDTRLQIFSYADFRNPDNWETELVRVINTIRESPISHQAMQLPANLVHPYLLQANFTGRVEERQALTAWLADDTQSVCAVVAMGGMGKSALTWHWLKEDVLTPTFAGEGAMWWSFYEGESSFAKFIDEALKYVSRQPIDATQFPTTYDRSQELLRQLQTRGVLFVLDGFERQLRAYAQLDAPYRQDDIADPTGDARACVDPIAARLLTNVAANTTRAKILLTTRLMVHNLEDSTGGDPLAGVFKHELKELPRADAVAFMRAQGVTKGTFAEIADVCDDYGNHPLSLRLLSGLIKRDKRTAGDIAAAPRVAARADFLRAQQHILEQSYDALPEKERALLSRIAAFRNPMSYDALSIFNDSGDDAEFDAVLEELQERGLVQRDIKNNRYDMHPIVRRYAYERLNDKADVHTRLLDYFAKLPVPDEDEVQSIEDLAPVIELYHHTVGAGRYDEARDLLSRRLVPDPLHFRFGAYQLMIELERALFPDGEDRPPRIMNESAQAWTLNALANSYSLSGQLRRAVPLLEQHNELREKAGDKLNLAIGLGNIAIIGQILQGKLTAAEQNLRRRIELCREIKDEFREAVGHQELGRLLTYRGMFVEAAQELEISLRYDLKVDDRQGQCVDESYRALRSLLMGDARDASEAARKARTLANALNTEVDIIRAEWLLGAALIMEGKDLNTADASLTNALNHSRRINLVHFEPDILLTWARWHRARGNAQEVQARAEEALAIADRCEFRLAQADIHNFLARLALDEGKYTVARQHAETARERAWCDGPPHCYKPALDEADGMLKELDAKEGK